LHQAFFEGEDPLILCAVFFAACASETLSLPKSLQARAKCALQDIWMAAIETYGIKYEKAVERLMKDREALLAFCAICYSGAARVTAWQRAGLEDVSPAAQPSPSLVIGGTRAPLTGTTPLPSADELFVGMFGMARDIDLPIAQFLDIVGIGRAFTANYGFSSDAVRYALEHPLRPSRSSMTGRAALEGRTVHIPDVLADPANTVRLNIDRYSATEPTSAYRFCVREARLASSHLPETK
jgi:hypothetical protein